MPLPSSSMQRSHFIERDLTALEEEKIGHKRHKKHKGLPGSFCAFCGLPFGYGLPRCAFLWPISFRRNHMVGSLGGDRDTWGMIMSTVGAMDCFACRARRG